MKIVYFKEENHKYTSGRTKYESVSGLWKPYFKPFDAEAVSIKKAYKELDIQAYTKAKKELSYEHPELITLLNDLSTVDTNEIIDLAMSYRKTWSTKAETGTAFHALQEQIDHDNGFRINPFTEKKSKLVKWDVKKGYDNQSSPYPMIEVPDGYIPELLVKVDELEEEKVHLAGQADMAFVETIGGVRYVDIDDWKTDAVILTKPEFFHRKTGFQKMIYPFNHIYETNYWKYAMKISTYAKMMELEGFVVRNLAFTHVLIDENLQIVEQTRYEIPYKSFEVDLALKMRIGNL